MFSSNFKYVMFPYVYVFICSIALNEMRANDRLHEGLSSVKQDSGVSLRPSNPLPRSHRDRQICFCGPIETTESASVVSLKLLNTLLRCH
jgi:hypothetical protein